MDVSRFSYVVKHNIVPETLHPAKVNMSAHHDLPTRSKGCSPTHDDSVKVPVERDGFNGQPWNRGARNREIDAAHPLDYRNKGVDHAEEWRRAAAMGNSPKTTQLTGAPRDRSRDRQRGNAKTRKATLESSPGCTSRLYSV